MFCSKWSKDPQPNWEKWKSKYYWRSGNKLIDGDSDAFPINPDDLSPEAFLIAYPGKVPPLSLKEFNQVLERHKAHPIKEVYIQNGGNLWTWYPMTKLDMQLTIFQETMSELIDKYLTIVPGKDIVIASLPFVNPALRMRDMTSQISLPKSIRKYIDPLKLNDIFMVANKLLKTICQKKGVIYYDIYTPLYLMWKQYGKSWWWDSVHYDNRARKILVAGLKTLWG